MDRRLTRRTLLVDLGRVTLGAVVLTACSERGTTPDAAAPTTATPTTGASDVDDGGADEETADDAAPTTPATWARASFGFVSAYVLVRDGEALVFDTGTGEDGVGAIGDALAEAGASWGAVAAVLVSHRHDDHAGGLEAVAAQARDAVVHAAMPDLGVLDTAGLATAEVADGDRVLGVRVVATPGHTAGHVCGHDEATGLLLVGDALVNGVAIGGTSGTGVELSPPRFTTDSSAAAASGELLAGLDYDVALFGHGEPITSDASAVVAADLAAA